MPKKKKAAKKKAAKKKTANTSALATAEKTAGYLACERWLKTFAKRMSTVTRSISAQAYPRMVEHWCGEKATTKEFIAAARDAGYRVQPGKSDDDFFNTETTIFNISYAAWWKWIDKQLA